MSTAKASNCSTCMFAASQEQEASFGSERVLVCRRYPPIKVVTPRPQMRDALTGNEYAPWISTEQPATRPDWWCGEYQPKAELK